MNALHVTRIALLAGGLAIAAPLAIPAHGGQPGERADPRQQEQRERSMPRQQDRRQMTERREQMREGRGMGMGMGRGMGPGMMDDEGSMTQAMEELRQSLEQLDLTEEQRRTLRELRQEHRQQQFERLARMMNLREDMQATMAEELPDPDEVRSVHGNMAEVHGDMLAEHLRFQNELQEILTDEQRTKLRELREEQ